MRDKTTRKQLDRLVELVAKELDIPSIPWSKEPDGTAKPNSKALIVEGWKPDERPRRYQLNQMDPSGGSRVIESSWFSAYEMKIYLKGILAGIDTMKNNPGNRGILK